MKNRVLMCSIMALLIVSCIRQNNTPKEYIKQINASSFSSKEEADLARAFSTGAFDLSSYREAQHFIQEQIENRIRFSDFSRTDLYATEENVSPSDILMKITELKEKKRYSAAYSICCKRKQSDLFCFCIFSRRYHFAYGNINYNNSQIR